MCVFWAKHKIFKLNVEDFPTIQKFFFCAQKFKKGSNMLKKGLTSEFRKRSFFKPPYYVIFLLEPLHIFVARPSVFFFCTLAITNIFLSNNKTVRFLCKVLKIRFWSCCFANKSKTTTWNKSKQKHWFFYKLYGFCCCAYQNKQKIKSSFFFVCLGLDLYFLHIYKKLFYRNETLFFKKRNGTIFFLEPKPKTEMK
jgi:hypothetical protein